MHMLVQQRASHAQKAPTQMNMVRQYAKVVHLVTTLLKRHRCAIHAHLAHLVLKGFVSLVRLAAMLLMKPCLGVRLVKTAR